MAGLGSILSSILLSPYTIGELMNIDSGRQERAAGCKVELVRTFHELKKETLLDKFKSFFSRNVVVMYYVIFKLRVTSGTGGVHNVIIRVNPDFNLQDWENNKVQVYCDCADFKYRSAYVLNRRGSLFLNDKLKVQLNESITTAPKGRTRTTLLCKHSFAALNWLVNNYSRIMKTI